MQEQAISKQEISEGAFLASVGYFGFLCLFPLIFQRQNRYSKFHGKQGFVLFISEILLTIGGGILFFLTNLIFHQLLRGIPLIGPFLDFIINVLVYWVFWVALFLSAFSFSLIGAYNAWNGNVWQMPLLWYYARRLKF